MRNESKESETNKYLVRAANRIIALIITLFVLFLVISGIIYLAPKIWVFAIA